MADLTGNQTVAQAFTRFGLGGRPDDALPSDAQSWLLQQLSGPDPMPTTGLPTLSSCLTEILNYQNATAGSLAKKQAEAAIKTTFAKEVQAFLAYAITTAVPFRERLVWFWTNHFALLTASFPATALAGVFIRDCIRPNVNGTFQDMLLSVMQHPAMIYSLDNENSIGPDSPYAVAHFKKTGQQLGFNENLGRECLELYTVGVDEGYTQADVDAMANILTGWTVDLSSSTGFTFVSNNHEPTAQTLLGQSFAGTYDGGIAALQMLATHPSTYNHLATKLVTHFVSDTPDPTDIATVAAALSNSGGNLAQAASAIVGLTSAWTPQSKFRTPVDYVVAVLRAAGITAATMPAAIGNILSHLGQPTWASPFPNGWSDLASTWLVGSQLLLRSDWVGTLTANLGTLDPVATANCSLGPFESALTASLMSQLSTVRDQLHLLFCSPEFQRR